MNIKTDLAHKENYGSSRNVSKIKYIVIHYTSNDGDTDENNGKYFKGTVTKTSAHYFVDGDSITQSVPDNYVAYHCGTTKGYKHATCRNTNSIGIELCDDVRNGVVYPSATTIENALELVRMLMKKYSIPQSNVIRHYDVTGKLCPAYWCGTTDKNNKWKSEFWNKLGTSVDEIKVEYSKAFDKKLSKTYYTTANLNLRCGAGTSKKVITVIPKGSKVTCYGYYTPVVGVKWLLVAYGNQTGFASSKYLR
jgi:N-acetylmuramoyl-L-alanine amidase CwlA